LHDRDAHPQQSPVFAFPIPGAVSRGIGTALLATALYGLVTHNMLHRYAEYLTTNFKDFLLRL
jgi:hypothetical protein